MQIIPLASQARPTDAAAKVLRRENQVPCTLYGNDVDNTQLVCDYSELYRTYAKAGESVLVELEIGGKKVPVLFHEVQFEPVSDKITHVDFYAVDMKKEIEARIPITFIGESEAVKSLGGVLVTVMDHVTVKCLPSNLPQHLDADISKLVDFTTSLLVSDIAVPADVVVSEAPDTMIATVQEPRREAVEETPAEGEEGEEAAAGDTAEKKDGEGDAPAEGGGEGEAKSE